MDFVNLSDEKILIKTKYFVSEEAKCVSHILSLLTENKKRKLYAQMGFDSLFEFCVKELGYSHSETQRRLSSAKLLDSVPEVLPLLNQGKLSLSALSQIQGHINHHEKTTQEGMSDLEKKKLVDMAQGKSTRDVEKELLKEKERKGMAEIPKKPVIRQVGSKESRFTVTLSSETLDFLKKAKSYMTKTKEISWEELFNKMARDFIEAQTPKWKREGNGNGEQTAQTHSRYIPKAVQEAVWKRAGGECEFISKETGRRCQSCHRLQYAHKKAFAKGGFATVENLSLMCFEHNSFEALKEFPVQYNAAVLIAGKVGHTTGNFPVNHLSMGRPKSKNPE